MSVIRVFGHYGVENVLAKREGALQRAFKLHAERFVRGMPRVQRPPRAVWINAPEENEAEEILRARGIMPAEEEAVAQQLSRPSVSESLTRIVLMCFPRIPLWSVGWLSFSALRTQ